MLPVNSDLLRPSLSDPAKLAAAPYSQQTGMLVAFFGGPLAIAVLLALDAGRLGRLGRDALWVALVIAGFAAWLWFVARTDAGPAFRAQLIEVLGRRGPAMIERLMALLAFALGMFLHRTEQRSATLFGLKRPNGWVMGIVLIVLGNAASALLHAAST
ncbi:MAG TPA: hypothetical protein VJ598_13680 [Albitalea sp.]|nr:hypothetical protein [Albitalea sp.]